MSDIKSGLLTKENQCNGGVNDYKEDLPHWVDNLSIELDIYVKRVGASLASLC